MMRNKILLSTVILSVLFSCKKAEEPVVENNPKPEVQEVAKQECYEYAKNKDTIQLQLSIDDTSVSGKMTYKLFEKDKNEGVIEGTMSGDTLFADYKFMSEGVESFRQVAFLKKNGTFTEGYGEVTEIDGKIVFKDKKTLTFSTMVLNEIPCK
jgi:hypothetical protein